MKKIIIKQISILLGATTFSAVCAVIMLGLNARSLGTEHFGALSLIQAYTTLISSITTFETWQPVIRLGVRLPKRLGATLSSGVVLDIIAAVTSTLIAILGIITLGAWTGVPEEHLDLAFIYSLSLLGNVAGTPKGYFRLIDRFDILAKNQIALAAALLLSSIVLWWTKASLITYIITFAIISFFYNISLLVRMLIFLRKSNIHFERPYKISAGRRIFKITLKASTGTSILSTLNSTKRPLSLLIVGWLLGEAGAGIYSVATKLISVLTKFSNLLLQVIFKEVMNLANEHQSETWRKLVLKFSLLSAIAAALCTIAFIPMANPLIAFSVGDEYLAASALLIALFAAESLNLATLHLNPVIQERTGPNPLNKVSAVSLAFHLLATLVLCHLLSELGAGIAALLSSILASSLMIFLTTKILKK